MCGWRNTIQFPGARPLNGRAIVVVVKDYKNEPDLHHELRDTSPDVYNPKGMGGQHTSSSSQRLPSAHSPQNDLICLVSMDLLVFAEAAARLTLHGMA